MAKEVTFKKGRESCNAGAKKSVFILRMQTHCAVTEPVLDVSGGGWGGAATERRMGPKRVTGSGSCIKAEVRGCEGGGSSYVKDAAYRTAASIGPVGCEDHDYMTEWKRSADWNVDWEVHKGKRRTQLSLAVCFSVSGSASRGMV